MTAIHVAILTMSQLLTIDEYLIAVQSNTLIDDDGYGHPIVNDTEIDDIKISPSNLGSDIPEGATYIRWFNK